MGQKVTTPTKPQSRPTTPESIPRWATPLTYQNILPDQTTPPVRQDHTHYEASSVISEDLPPYQVISPYQNIAGICQDYPPDQTISPIHQEYLPYRAPPPAYQEYLPYRAPPPIVQPPALVAQYLRPVVRLILEPIIPQTMCEIRKFHHKVCGQFISRVFAHSPDCQRTDCQWTEVDFSVDRVCPWCDRSVSATLTDTHSRLGELSGGELAGTCEMKMLRHGCCGSSYQCIVTHKGNCSQEECVWVFLDEIVDVTCEECKEMGDLLAHFGE